MQITNELRLPESIVEAVKNDEYTRGDSDISVTQLIDPPQKIALIEANDDKIVEDASDRLWSLYGQLIHGLLERADTGAVTEQRLYMEILGWKIGGQMDRLVIGEGKDPDALILEDYKFTTVYSVKGGQPKKEWIEQQNCYAQILRSNGFKVDAINVVVIFRDWSKMKVLREQDYPRKQAVSIPIPLWTEERTLTFMRERVMLHQSVRAGNKIECTPDEQWAKPTKHAVMKKGRKSAMRVLESEYDAIQWCVLKGHADSTGLLYAGFYIDIRPGEFTRCLHYCAASPFCKQFKDSEIS